MTAKALVLCAGHGTRLGELTRWRPKPVLEIGGEPLIAYALSHLAASGIREVALNLHYLPHLVREAVGDGGRFGVHVTYREEPELLGTAGAVSNLRDFFADADEALVIYGDLLLDQDLEGLLEAHRSLGADATLLLHQRARSNSVVAMDERRRITAFLERPTEAERAAVVSSWVNSGCQVLSADLVSQLPRGCPADLPRDVYAPHVSDLALFGFPLSGYRCAIDSPARYAEAEAAVAAGKVRITLPRAEPR